MDSDTAYELEAARAGSDDLQLAHALRRHAATLLANGMPEDAEDALGEAWALFSRRGADTEADECLALMARTDFAAAVDTPPASGAAVAEHALNQMSLRLAQGDAAGATAAAVLARDAAEAERLTQPFVAAVTGLAQVHEHLGDHVSAHAAALEGRDTLAGWLDPAAAAALLAALFEGQKRRWGEDNYARVAALLHGTGAPR